MVQEKLHTLSGQIHTLPKGDAALFLGAGVSVAAGIDTTAGIIDKVVQTHLSATQFQSLVESAKYDKFKELLRTLYRTRSARRSLFKPFFENREPSQGLTSLASLCREKYFKCIFTTNFDALLGKALGKLSLSEREDFEEHIVGRSREDDEGIIDIINSEADLIHIVKLHGDYGSGIMPFSEAKWQFSEPMEKFLVDYLRSHMILFAGYSGYDEDLLFLLEQAADSFKPVWWVNLIELASDARIKGALINKDFHDFFVKRNSSGNLIYGDDGNSENFFTFLENRLTELRHEQEQKQPVPSMLVAVSEAFVQQHRQPGYRAPLMFYEGRTSSSYWAVIAYNLDIIREEHLTAMQIVLEAIGSPRVSLVALIGPPGSGKTTSLLRLGYELAKNEALAIFKLRKYMRESFGDSLIRLGNALSKPVIVLVDDLATCDDAITQTLNEVCMQESKGKSTLTEPIVFLIAATERELENADIFKAIGRLRGRISRVEMVPLKVIQESDIEKLLAKWREKCTGSSMVSVHLRSFLTKSPIEQKRLFLQRARKQLLVALYEVTRNKDIENILLDEFNGLPQVAREAYLDVCLGYRHDVLSPRSLLETKYDYRDYHFDENVLRPCRGIVHQQCWSIKEYQYGKLVAERKPFLRGRHPLIAKLVFESIITEAFDRLERFKSIVDVSCSHYSRHHAFYILSALEAMLSAARFEPIGPRKSSEIRFNIEVLRRFVSTHWWVEYGFKVIVDKAYENRDAQQLVRWGIFLNHLGHKAILYEEALYCFEKACKIDYDLPAAQYYRAMIRLNQAVATHDDLVQAAQVLAARLENDQITQSQRYFTYLLARLKALGRDIEKISLQIEALHIKPDHDVTYEGLRQSMQGLEDRAIIKSLLPKYLQLMHSSQKRWSLMKIALANRAVGLLYLKLPDTRNAQEYLNNALQTLKVIASPDEEQSRLLAGVGNELAIVNDTRGSYPAADDLWQDMWEKVYELEWIPIERGWRWYRREDGKHTSDECIAEILKGVDSAGERGNARAVDEGRRRILAIQSNRAKK